MNIIGLLWLVNNMGFDKVIQINCKITNLLFLIKSCSKFNFIAVYNLSSMFGCPVYYRINP